MSINKEVNQSPKHLYTGAEIIDQLVGDLHWLGSSLVIPDSEENIRFREQTDGLIDHQPKWHEFGVLSHTMQVISTYETVLPELLRVWFKTDPDTVLLPLQQKIAGLSKHELLEISLVLHDLGKFQSPYDKSGKKRDHEKHEEKSGNLVRTYEPLVNLLRKLGITPEQKEYLAQCAELHYVLGKTRKAAKQSPTGYSIEFAQSELAIKACKEIMEQFPELSLEVGVMFLCDSIAKYGHSLELQFANLPDSEDKGDSAIALVEYFPSTDNLSENDDPFPPAYKDLKDQAEVNLALSKTYLKLLFAT